MSRFLEAGWLPHISFSIKGGMPDQPVMPKKTVHYLYTNIIE